MAEDTDVIDAVVALLRADAQVALLAGTDVYGVELPNEAVGRMPGSMLVIQPSGGTPLTEGSDVALDAQRFDLMAYGATVREANRLRAAGARALRLTKRKVVSGTLIHWVGRAGGFYAARDRDGLWPQSFQSFQIFYSLTEV